MIYVYSPDNFMYHKSHYDKRGRLSTKYYELKQGQVLTVCEAIQNFEMTIDEIMNEYDLFIIQLNRRNTEKDEDNRRFIVEGCNNFIVVS